MSVWYHGSRTDALKSGLASSTLYVTSSRSLAETPEFSGKGGYVFEVDVDDQLEIFDPYSVTSATEFDSLAEFLESLPSDTYRSAITRAARRFFSSAIAPLSRADGMEEIEHDPVIQYEDWASLSDRIIDGEFRGEVSAFWSLFSNLLSNHVGEGGYWSYTDDQLGLSMDADAARAGFVGHYETEEGWPSVRNLALYNAQKSARVVGYSKVK